MVATYQVNRTLSSGMLPHCTPYICYTANIFHAAVEGILDDLLPKSDVIDPTQESEAEQTSASPKKDMSVEEATAWAKEVYAGTPTANKRKPKTPPTEKTVRSTSTSSRKRPLFKISSDGSPIQTKVFLPQESAGGKQQETRGSKKRRGNHYM